MDLRAESGEHLTATLYVPSGDVNASSLLNALLRLLPALGSELNICINHHVYGKLSAIKVLGQEHHKGTRCTCLNQKKTRDQRTSATCCKLRTNIA
eukprot:2808346-Amphidinium_carterae.1